MNEKVIALQNTPTEALEFAQANLLAMHRAGASEKFISLQEDVIMLLKTFLNSAEVIDLGVTDTKNRS